MYVGYFMDEVLEVSNSLSWCMILYENPSVPREHDGAVGASLSDVHGKQLWGKGTLHLGGE